eukprot:1208-Heterococcus_DN1.PRE.1
MRVDQVTGSLRNIRYDCNRRVVTPFEKSAIVLRCVRQGEAGCQEDHPGMHTAEPSPVNSSNGDAAARASVPGFSNMPAQSYNKMHQNSEQSEEADRIQVSLSPPADRSDVAPPQPIAKVELTDKSLFRYVVPAAALLAFNAGYMNCLGMRAYHGEVVSHVTGHATKAAEELGTNSMSDFFNEICIMTFFILGSSFTGWLIGKEKLTLGQSYGRLMCCTGTVVFLAMCAGITPDREHRKPYFCLYMLAMACGMQNAMTTRYSGAVVRTTHLTGMFTDMGLLIGHMLRSDRDFQDMWKFSLFIPIILGKLMPCCYW